MQKIFLFILLLLRVALAHAQTWHITGTISSGKEVLPFATILVDHSTTGTHSNLEGKYALKLPAGKYDLSFQYVGFAKKTITIDLQADTQLDIELDTDGIPLTEVTVNAGEDPANPVIRKAIRKKAYYRHQVKTYTCRAYIKGLQKIEALPKNIGGLIKLAGRELSDTAQIKGVIYLSESESKYHYEAPAKEKEIMYSSRVSGDNRSFSFNQLSDMKLNFYSNLVDMSSVSARQFISPLNENAFFYYRYFLLGKIESHEKTINKIKVVPKRPTDPCFSGVIYIQDSTWRITGVDLMLTKEVKIAYVDTLYIRQLYTPVIGDSVWMPVSLHFSFDFKVMGFKGGGYFDAHISDYKLDTTYARDFFNDEILVVQEGANKKDSLYWQKARVIPLTQEEVNDYRQKDSLVVITGTDRYKDSTDRVANKLKFRDVLLGYRYQRTKSNFYLNIPGIITNGIQYNTVEGVNLSYNFGASKVYDDKTEYVINGKLRYGFANKLWGGELGYSRLLNPFHRRRVGFVAKSITEQFNKAEPIQPLINSIYTLFVNENHMKLFRETGVSGFYSTELINGIYFTATGSWLQRYPLANSTDLLLFNNVNKRFTSNDPLNPFNDQSSFTSHQSLFVEMQFNIRFRQKYQTLPNEKVITGSKYPRLMIYLKKAIPTGKNGADYNFVAATVSDAVRLGVFGRLRYFTSAGLFIDARRTYLMDYRHFYGNQTIVITFDYLRNFRLLPYYAHSANNWFTEAHVEHHFQGLLLGFLPLVKKTALREVAGFHFLSNNTISNYYEINFGLEKIFKVVRCDYVLGYFPGGDVRHGFTAGLYIAL